MLIDKFENKVLSLIQLIGEEEKENIHQAAIIMFEAMKKGKIVHVFATGHSHMFAEELFYRACGLVQIDPILIPELMQHEGAVSSTKRERESGKAEQIFKNWDIQPEEPMIIVSNSGINAVPVEMAELCKKNHLPVIVLTSVASSKVLSPRNRFNKHLYEMGDVVIDNHAPFGDGCIQKEYGRIGAVSSIIGSFIAQSLVLEIIELFELSNLTPPIYQSANTPGGDEHNKELMKKYKERIKCLY